MKACCTLLPKISIALLLSFIPCSISFATEPNAIAVPQDTRGVCYRVCAAENTCQESCFTLEQNKNYDIEPEGNLHLYLPTTPKVVAFVLEYAIIREIETSYLCKIREAEPFPTSEPAPIGFLQESTTSDQTCSAHKEDELHQKIIAYFAGAKLPITGLSGEDIEKILEETYIGGINSNPLNSKTVSKGLKTLSAATKAINAYAKNQVRPEIQYISSGVARYLQLKDEDSTIKKIQAKRDDVQQLLDDGIQKHAPLTKVRTDTMKILEEQDSKNWYKESYVKLRSGTASLKITNDALKLTQGIGPGLLQTMGSIVAIPNLIILLVSGYEKCLPAFNEALAKMGHQMDPEDLEEIQNDYQKRMVFESIDGVRPTLLASGLSCSAAIAKLMAFGGAHLATAGTAGMVATAVTSASSYGVELAMDTYGDLNTLEDSDRSKTLKLFLETFKENPMQDPSDEYIEAYTSIKGQRIGGDQEEVDEWVNSKIREHATRKLLVENPGLQRYIILIVLAEEHAIGEDNTARLLALKYNADVSEILNAATLAVDQGPNSIVAQEVLSAALGI